MRRESLIASSSVQGRKESQWLDGVDGASDNGEMNGNGNGVPDGEVSNGVVNGDV